MLVSVVLFPYNGDIPMSISERIKGCIAIEKAVASIYGSFVKMFPEEKTFWEELLKDELEHRDFLKDAEFLKMFSKLPRQLHPPSHQFIVNTLKFLKNISREITHNPLALKEALEIALKIEETMVETFSNELIADLKTMDADTYAPDLEKMLIEERGHISKVKNKMVQKGFLKVS